MYQTFKDMVHELFEDSDFTETCYINGFEHKCICSPLSNDLAYTAAGLESGENFTLDLELDELHDVPQEGEKIIFRDKQYKISSTLTDSACASIKLFLIALSKGA